MKVSVIMPSHLSEFDGSATQRPEKFVRAVRSFLNQSHPEKELIIVADGCKITEELYDKLFSEEREISFCSLRKQRRFAGYPRQMGINHSTGEVIMYLDSDDYLTVSHIETVVTAMIRHELDWCYFDDYTKANFEHSRIRNVDLVQGRVGVSNIAHKKNIAASWNGCDGAGHTWPFVKQLLSQNENKKKIYACGYVVCHIEKILDL